MGIFYLSFVVIPNIRVWNRLNLHSLKCYPYIHLLPLILTIVFLHRLLPSPNWIGRLASQLYIYVHTHTYTHLPFNQGRKHLPKMNNWKKINDITVF